MSEAETLHRFHVIFIAQSVDRLLPLFANMVENTTVAYRVVANGCTPEEIATLRAYCSSDVRRLEFRDLEVDSTVDHGRALKRLLAVEPSDGFSFLDSDIFATQHVDLDELRPSRFEAARSSALPFWHTKRDLRMPEGFQILGGRFTTLADGSPTGTTYAASYHTDLLRATMSKWGVGLSTMRWERLPEPVQAHFEERGWRFAIYDTAKVVNLLLLDEGPGVRQVELDGIIHLGAQSGGLRRTESAGLTWKMRSVRFVRDCVPQAAYFLWRRRGFGHREASDLVGLANRRSRAFLQLSEVISTPRRRPRRRAAPAPPWLDELQRIQSAGVRK